MVTSYSLVSCQDAGGNNTGGRIGTLRYAYSPGLVTVTIPNVGATAFNGTVILRCLVIDAGR